MKKFLGIALMFALCLIGASCGSSSNSSSSTPTSSAQSGNVFVTGEDAPLASVVGFDVTINSITLTGKNGTPQVLSTATTVDFARLLGLRSPLGFNSVPADTYTSATISLSNPVISYVQLNPTPVVNTVNATFSPTTNSTTQTSVTVNFPAPMVVGSNGLAGLRMDFDIRQSVAVDGSGNVTGAVNPTIYVKAVQASDNEAQITDLMGGLVSVSTSGNSFVIQGPYGHQLTVDVNGSTKFNSGWNINDLATPAIVGVQGQYQADGTLIASGVEVITTSQSFISGRVLQVTSNSSGQAQQLIMWVGETGADMVSDVDTIQTVDVSAISTYDICFFNGPLTQYLFNNTSVEVGQRVFVGGSFSNGTFTPSMLSLRLQGVYGTFVPGSVSIIENNTGSFQLSNDGLVGYSAGGPVTVNTFNLTYFYDLNGLGQLQTTTTAIPLVTRGLFLKDPVSGNPEMYAGIVSDPPQSN
ncbi:MAG: DUF4382 domain-containing protein [Candidatus Sulfotelmatobacter sp.]